MTPKVLFGQDIAPHYEAWFETEEGQRADQLEKALLARLLAELEPPDDVLEIGCGTGHFARWMSTLGWQVWGVDLSAPMLAEAQAHGAAGELAQGDALHLPFADACCSVAALFTVIEFLPDVEAALREAWRVARRGLLIGAINRHSLLGYGYRQQAKKAPNVYSQARFWSPGELARLVRRTAGAPLTVQTATTLWPTWLPLERLHLPWGGFIGLVARRK
jgi:ubiquinone/menaquinone biosynthesis C-methylase UbiE